MTIRVLLSIDKWSTLINYRQIWASTFVKYDTKVKMNLDFFPFFSDINELIDFFPVTTSQPPQRPWIPLANPERNRPVGEYSAVLPSVLRTWYIYVNAKPKENIITSDNSEPVHEGSINLMCWQSKYQWFTTYSVNLMEWRN